MFVSRAGAMICPANEELLGSHFSHEAGPGYAEHTVKSHRK